MGMNNGPTTIWIQPETHERMKSLKSEAMTFDELVNAALDESDIDNAKQLQRED